uniref:Thioredoxin-like fold domain-containing protein n=1 Tax=Fibrocapsa japonica TaxID=94617 RepID=A0A7S2V1J5_9STRA|mmetsp:Transcript_20175/g.29155  ORF Transcript_20175/g.29155 Transcript_20175/m.29155 type:complete len:197 (+) Transcript_20175:32-622(+)
MPPPFPKTPTGISLSKCASPKTVIEAFLDFQCPFSVKMYNKLTAEVVPHYQSAHPGEIDFVIHQVPQPWHPQSCLMHMALWAVREVGPPEAVAPMMNALCELQPSFSDEYCMDKTRRELFQQLAGLAGAAGSSQEGVLNMLLEGKSAQGIKFLCKYHRTRGVHVTPTVMLNGLVANHIESSFSVDQWKEAVDGFLA